MPFNLAFHDFMIFCGADYERRPEYWEDTGDAESGPSLDGYLVHDIYMLDDEEYVIFEDGSTDRGPAAPPMIEPYGC